MHRYGESLLNCAGLRASPSEKRERKNMSDEVLPAEKETILYNKSLGKL